MALQRVVKTYPLVPVALVVSGILVVIGIVTSGIVSDPDGADVNTLLLFLAAAVVLPFLTLLIRRRRVVTVEMPSDHLAAMSKSELEGVLAQLDAAKAKGDMDDPRYANARERVMAALKSKGKAK
jgi:predicted MFS family arabinose efflux permease